jgi:hypothetical protein
MNQFEKYSMNNKLSKTLIKHYNTCFLRLKGFINRLQILGSRLKKCLSKCGYILCYVKNVDAMVRTCLSM